MLTLKMRGLVTPNGVHINQAVRTRSGLGKSSTTIVSLTPSDRANTFMTPFVSSLLPNTEVSTKGGTPHESPTVASGGIFVGHTPRTRRSAAAKDTLAKEEITKAMKKYANEAIVGAGVWNQESRVDCNANTLPFLGIASGENTFGDKL